ncbi:hypothetical protein BD309DRAFT_855061 [Dichomitus squalens]|nr:hypothetical protein BD309DRAFT_855061 [Dichomitus squalens]
MSYDHNDFTHSDDDFIQDLVAAGFILAERDESLQQGGEDPQSSSHAREDASQVSCYTQPIASQILIILRGNYDQPSHVFQLRISTPAPTPTLPAHSSPATPPATVASFASTAPLCDASPVPVAPGQLPDLPPSPASTPANDDDEDDKENSAAPLPSGPQALRSDKGKGKEVAASPSPLPTPPARPAKRCRADHAGGSNADQMVSRKRARKGTDRPAPTPPEPEALDEDTGKPCPYLVSRHSQLTCGVRGCSEVLKVSGLSAARAHFREHFAGDSSPSLGTPGPSRPRKTTVAQYPDYGTEVKCPWGGCHDHFTLEHMQLNRHLEEDHFGIRYECPHCGQEFMRQTYLTTNHMKKCGKSSRRKGKGRKGKSRKGKGRDSRALPRGRTLVLSSSPRRRPVAIIPNIYSPNIYPSYIYPSYIHPSNMSTTTVVAAQNPPLRPILLHPAPTADTTAPATSATSPANTTRVTIADPGPAQLPTTPRRVSPRTASPPPAPTTTTTTGPERRARRASQAERAAQRLTPNGALRPGARPRRRRRRPNQDPNAENVAALAGAVREAEERASAHADFLYAVYSGDPHVWSPSSYPANWAGSDDRVRLAERQV